MSKHDTRASTSLVHALTRWGIAAALLASSRGNQCTRKQHACPRRKNRTRQQWAEAATRPGDPGCAAQPRPRGVQTSMSPPGQHKQLLRTHELCCWACGNAPTQLKGAGNRGAYPGEPDAVVERAHALVACDVRQRAQRACRRPIAHHHAPPVAKENQTLVAFNSELF